MTHCRVTRQKYVRNFQHLKLMGPLRPLNFCQTLQLPYTVGFSLIDVKLTQQASCVSQLSAEKRQIQFIFKINIL